MLYTPSGAVVDYTFACPCSLYLCTSTSGSHIQKRDSKQIAMATSFRMLALLLRRTFWLNVEKIYLTRRRKNYQTINCKNKNLNFAVFCLTLANFLVLFNFFCLTLVAAMVSIKFSHGKFHGQRPGMSALRMLPRLTAVNTQGPLPRCWERGRETGKLRNYNYCFLFVNRTSLLANLNLILKVYMYIHCLSFIAGFLCRKNLILPQSFPWQPATEQEAWGLWGQHWASVDKF